MVPRTGTAPYSWQWLYSTDDGASYEPATAAQCATPGGVAAASGAQESCTFSTTEATPPGTYYFELRVTDSATVPESVTSAASSTVMVEPAHASGTRSDTAAPKFDTDPQEDCTHTCDTANWFGGTGGSGALAITTASADELLVLEITDSGQTGADLSVADISDTRGSTWDLEPANEWDGFGHDQYVFYALDAVAGADTVTIDTAAGTHTAADDATAVLAAFTGVDTSAPIAAEGTFEEGTGTQSTASVTTHVAPTTILGVVSTTNGATAFTSTASPAFTEAGTINDGAATASFVEYYANTATGTYTSEPTWTGSVRWGAVAIAIQGASPLSVTVAPTTTVLDLGQSATIAATATGGTGTLTYSWSVASGTCPGFANSGTSTLSYTPSGTTGACVLTVTVEDSDSDTAEPATSASVTVNTALAAPSAPTVSSASIDQGQLATAATDTLPNPLGGTGTVTYTWLVDFDSGGYAAATSTQCATPSGTASNGLVVNCVVGASVAVGTYTYEIKLTDSATTPSVTTSSASGTVTVNTALASVSAPTVSSASIDQGQSVTAATDTLANPLGGSGTVTYTWLVDYDSGGYVAATSTQCATPGGTASNGQLLSCVVGATVAVGTYTYEVKLTDSATTPATSTSSASGTVTVNTALATTSAPTIATAIIDRGQTPTAATDTLPSSLEGSGTVTYTWLVDFDSGGYAAATSTQCATPSGTASNGLVVNCVVGASVAVGTYTYEIQLTDSATTPSITTSSASGTVTVNTALATSSAPTISTAIIDRGQTPTAATDTLPSALEGSGTVTYTWLVDFDSGGYVAATSTQCATPSGTASNGLVVNCVVGASVAVGTYTYEIQLTDSATTPSITTSSASGTATVNTALIVPTPTPGSQTVDRGQTATITGTAPTTGTNPYTYQWLEEAPGASSYSDAADCASPTTLTCSFVTGGSTPTGTYSFELQVTDSATTHSVVDSSALTITVNTALAAPGAPTVSATALDVNQALTVTGTIPTTGTSPYAWSWLVSANGAGYGTATECAVSGGTGASAGTPETCLIAAGSFTAGVTLAFELYVSDGATTPELATSPASGTVTVNSALTAPAAPLPNATSIDESESLSVAGVIPSDGTSTYSWQWLISVDGGTYSDATPCGASASGVGALAAAPEVCSIPSGTLVAGDSYTFELEVSDTASNPESVTSAVSAVVTVSSSLLGGAPGPSGVVLDDGQSVLLSSNSSGGSGGYTYQWYSGSSVSACESLGSPIAGATGMTFDAQPSSTTYYCYVVEDSDSARAASVSVLVTVNPALTGPAAPSTSATALDVDQLLTVTGTVPSTGTAPYGWEWFVSVNGATFADASVCDIASGAGASAAALETCDISANTLTVGDTYTFELEVTDNASTPESETSTASGTVTVANALTAPGAPAPSATALDINQALTVTGTIPSTGTSPYSWQWLVSINGGADANATLCAQNNGTGAAGGGTETCSIATGTLTPGDTYSFALRVLDSSGAGPETEVSSLSLVVTASSPLTAPTAPAVSSSSLSLAESLTVTSALPSTGTPRFAWQWLISTDGGAYTSASVCGSAASGTGGAAGSTVQCTVPNGALVPGSSYTFELRVTDSATSAESATSSASSAVTVAQPAIEVGTNQGPAGAHYVVTGSGFSASSAVTVSFGSVLATPTACSDGSFAGTQITTDASGRFACTFTVPSEASGVYPVLGTDVASSSATVAFSFTVTLPAITVSPSQGQVGGTVTVNGTGFSVSSPLASLIFDSRAITTCLSGSLTTNSVGAFSCTFGAPNGISGSIVRATDVGGASASATYAIVTASAPSSSGSDWLWIALGVVLVSLFVIVLGVRRRRSTRREETPGSFAPGPSASGPPGRATFPPEATAPTTPPSAGIALVLAPATEAEPTSEPVVPAGVPTVPAAAELVGGFAPEVGPDPYSTAPDELTEATAEPVAEVPETTPTRTVTDTEIPSAPGIETTAELDSGLAASPQEVPTETETSPGAEPEVAVPSLAAAFSLDAMDESPPSEPDRSGPAADAESSVREVGPSPPDLPAEPSGPSISSDSELPTSSVPTMEGEPQETAPAPEAEKAPPDSTSDEAPISSEEWTPPSPVTETTEPGSTPPAEAPIDADLAPPAEGTLEPFPAAMSEARASDAPDALGATEGSTTEIPHEVEPVVSPPEEASAGARSTAETPVDPEREDQSEVVAPGPSQEVPGSEVSPPIPLTGEVTSPTAVEPVTPPRTEPVAPLTEAVANTSEPLSEFSSELDPTSSEIRLREPTLPPPTSLPPEPLEPEAVVRPDTTEETIPPASPVEPSPEKLPGPIPEPDRGIAPALPAHPPAGPLAAARLSSIFRIPLPMPAALPNSSSPESPREPLAAPSSATQPPGSDRSEKPEETHRRPEEPSDVPPSPTSAVEGPPAPETNPTPLPFSAEVPLPEPVPSLGSVGSPSVTSNDVATPSATLPPKSSPPAASSETGSILGETLPVLAPSPPADEPSPGLEPPPPTDQDGPEFRLASFLWDLEETGRPSPEDLPKKPMTPKSGEGSSGPSEGNAA